MTTPMYQEIADLLRGRIESGEFPPAERLPTEADLQIEYSASRNTIRDAIKQLTTLGLVETKPGQGTFVVTPIDPFVTTLTGDPGTARGGDEGASYASEISDEQREPSFSPVQVEIQDASAEVADGLWIEPGVEVISRHQRRFVN